MGTAEERDGVLEGFFVVTRDGDIVGRDVGADERILLGRKVGPFEGEREGDKEGDDVKHDEAISVEQVSKYDGKESYGLG